MPQIGAGSDTDPVDRYPGGAHKPEEFVAKLRQVDVLVSQGQSMAETVRPIGVTQFTYYRWCKERAMVRDWSEDNGACGLKTDRVKRRKELEKDRAIECHWSEPNGEGTASEGGLRPDAREAHLARGRFGNRRSAPAKLLSPARRRRCVDHVRQELDVSERLACRVLGQHRSTQRKVPHGRADEEALTADIIALASEYGRYGYRGITALLRDAGWAVNVKRPSHGLLCKPLSGSGRAAQWHSTVVLGPMADKVSFFYSLAEAKIVIESWRRHYHTKRPHSSPGYRPPAPLTVSWPDA